MSLVDYLNPGHPNVPDDMPLVTLKIDGEAGALACLAGGGAVGDFHLASGLGCIRGALFERIQGGTLVSCDCG